MKRRTLVRFFCALGSTAVAGCTEQLGGGGQSEDTPTPMPPPVDEMELSIFDARPPNLGGRSATLTVILEATNPTDRPIPSPSGELDVSVNGQRVVTAEPTLNTLEPGETAKKSIEIIIEYLEVGESIGSALRDGSFRLELSGLIRSKDASKEVSLAYQY